VSAPLPGQTNPGQILAKALLLLTEVTAQIEFGGAHAKVSQRGQLPLDPGAADLWRRIVHGVGDDHTAAAVPTQ
jgi:hypothetical protein